MRLTCAAVLLVSVLGCRMDAGGVGLPVPPKSQTTLRPAGAISRLDNEVVTVVLRDLLSYGGEDSPRAHQGQPAEQVQFFASPYTRAIRLRDILYKHKQERWDALSPAALAGVEEAARNILLRTSNPEAEAEFTVEDPRATIREGPASFGNRAISIWLPGYSADRRIALVLLSIPWSIHECRATYVLSRQKEGWQVSLRQYLYFL